MHALYCTYGAINHGVRYCHFVKGAGKIKIMHQLSNLHLVLPIMMNNYLWMLVKDTLADLDGGFFSSRVDARGGYCNPHHDLLPNFSNYFLVSILTQKQKQNSELNQLLPNGCQTAKPPLDPYNTCSSILDYYFSTSNNARD